MFVTFANSIVILGTFFQQYLLTGNCQEAWDLHQPQDQPVTEISYPIQYPLLRSGAQARYGEVVVRQDFESFSHARHQGLNCSYSSRSTLTVLGYLCLSEHTRSVFTI